MSEPTTCVGEVQEKCEIHSKKTEDKSDPSDDSERAIPQDPSASTSSAGPCSCTGEAAAKTSGEGDRSKRVPLTKQSSGDSSSRGSSVDRASPPLVGRTTSLVEKRRHREEKHIDEVMKTLSVLESPDQKFAALCAKYAALLEENNIMQKSLRETQKLYTAVVKDKDKKEEEYNRALLAKVKLETLCRELQKANKAIKEESMERLKQQESSRQDLSEKFRTSLNEIHNAMAAGKDRSDRLSDDNANLAKKLQSLAEQYESKQEQSIKLMEKRDLQVQLYDAKLQAASLQLQKMTEEKLKDEHQMLLKLKERDEQLKEAMESEKLLREQMAMYSAKYDDLHKSLSDSNSTFEKFQREMERMNNSLIKCERESRRWKAKFEETSSSLIDVAEGRAQLEKKLVQEQKRREKLEKLSRTLQEERAELIKRIDDNRGDNSKETVGGEESVEKDHVHEE